MELTEQALQVSFASLLVSICRCDRAVLWDFLSFCFLALDFEFRAYTPQALFFDGFFEIGPLKLFPLAGFQQWSSWSLPFK
jgi:hypothetical protein